MSDNNRPARPLTEREKQFMAAFREPLESERLVDEITDCNWRDAERYRWLRQQFINGVTTKASFDAKIDSAIAAAKSKSREQEK